MELRDFIVTPIILLLVGLTAYAVRPYVCDNITKRFFFPALTVKIIGALLLGFLYQFYYSGGDTYNYHTYGSRVIWEAILEDPAVGFKLLFSDGHLFIGSYKYASKIIFFTDPPSFAIVRIATIFDLVTYSTYSATAIFFALISFSGCWAMFTTFYKKYDHLVFPLALATLFVPTTIFWGSGILKDSVILGSLGFAVFSIDLLFIQKKIRIRFIVLLLISLFTIFTIRKFILQAFIPSAVLWIYFKNLTQLRSTILKIILAPLIVAAFVLTSYYSVVKVGEGDKKYALDKIAETSRITAYDIGFYTGANAGSGYSIGELDGSFSSMLQLAPQAINVSLFRPYLWEVKNPLMLFSSLEGLFFLGFTFYVFIRGRSNFAAILSDPNIVFCLLFSIAMAFAVGVSTFNFGTLVRYKAPLLPFYLVALLLANSRLRTPTNF